MTWTKLSDDFSDDCWRLSDAAWRLHVEGLLWSNRKLLDLTLDKSDMVRWAKHPAAADELVAAGWWRDRGNHYVIVHHGAYQRTREAVLKQQAANKANGQKGGRPSREQAADLKPAETKSVSETRSESKTERDRTGRACTGELSPEKNETVGAPSGGLTSTTPGQTERVHQALGDARAGLGQRKCLCGRPGPVRGDTGTCEWCAIKARRAAAEGVVS